MMVITLTKCLLMPSAGPSVAEGSPLLILWEVPSVRCYCHPHFTDEETEAEQRGWETSSGSCGHQVQGQGLEYQVLTYRATGQHSPLLRLRAGQCVTAQVWLRSWRPGVHSVVLLGDTGQAA